MAHLQPISLLRLLLFLLTSAVSGIRVDVIRQPISHPPPPLPIFREAPAYRNADECAPRGKVHIAMTIDANYLRGTMAAVLSILQHTSCPENVTFHFLYGHLQAEILRSIRSTFPYLDFVMHRFDQNRVRGRISRSIRQALDQPLNYARVYLADVLPAEVGRVIYLDSDVIVVDDIATLWEVDLEDKMKQIKNNEGYWGKFPIFFPSPLPPSTPRQGVQALRADHGLLLHLILLGCCNNPYSSL